MEGGKHPDGRRCERLPARIRITLRVGSEGHAIERIASAVDLSTHGVRVRTNLVLSPGQTLDLFSRGGRMRPVPGRVVWVRTSESNRPREAGLEFLDSLPEAVEGQPA